ncbi:hypothetical protein NAL32_00395 [Chryseobacterium sp. Ch-15]|uniref:Uncharacterized protein n=1 Tax=Chryseobacterium muglaense TaxID=2893752 RepID=A0A9Q3UT16_9FLAO|nr:hypothetical protein [Chryseobacterium muglaense]MBD3903507.1 hypothetical protein [Chryseobacterium muglaense]MCC9034579.1 hypothetical protein [Chryseobacterium muglaense]MCM2552842.1 hypothetical protein [Chryseobacterium muglaense]
MENKFEFTEKQRFTQWWLWLLLSAVMVYTIYNLIEDRQYFSTLELTLSIALPILIIILFLSLRLETKIDEHGISVRFFPFQITFRYYPWKNIKKAYVRKYSPLAEYGGWGLRQGLFGTGKAYNVKGNQGLQIILNDEKKVLIGTQKFEEMGKFLTEIKS